MLKNRRLLLAVAVFLSVIPLTWYIRDNSTGPIGDVSFMAIENIRIKEFKPEEPEIIKTIEDNKIYKSYLITYRSEGLRITGLMNVPEGKGPFPVIFLNYGHYQFKKYRTGDGTKEAADLFARNGYVAVSPDYRNYGGSDKGSELFFTGYVYDLMNLIESVKRLKYVDKDRIGLEGHSMGAAVVVKTIVIRKNIKAAAVFGSMSPDDIENYNALINWGVPLGKEIKRIFGTPENNPELYYKMSPINYFKDVSSPVIIHIGEEDKNTSPAWSITLRDALIKAGKKVEYYSYPAEGHTLEGKAWDEAMKRTLTFFDQYVKKGRPLRQISN
ncbi:MAG: prolyl oligopeptidase family serine peptidase [Nitrospinae bacterium]|nr:prolyl oligopeptidase family serine peptidase [Nitrospinota bacterium]